MFQNSPYRVDHIIKSDTIILGQMPVNETIYCKHLYLNGFNWCSYFALDIQCPICSTSWVYDYNQQVKLKCLRQFFKWFTSSKVAQIHVNDTQKWTNLQLFSHKIFQATRKKMNSKDIVILRRQILLLMSFWHARILDQVWSSSLVF